MKVMTIVGTRPELIRLCRTISVLDDVFDHKLVHTGQNFDFELNEVFFNDLEIRKPDHFLNAAGDNFGTTISNVISASYDVLIKENPDAVLILGDTNSSLSAIVAKRLKIPIFHMEAGNRCFNLNVPEEINRQIVDKISDINLPYSKIAREYLIMEGFAPDRIIVTGSPIKEVATYFSKKITSSRILSELNLTSGEYFLLSLHREENVDDVDRLSKIIGSLTNLSEKFGKKIVFSVHPRTKQKLENLQDCSPEHFLLCKPFGYFDYVTLQKNSFCTLSDSGTISEEANILNFRAVNLRDEHERPEAFEAAAVPFSGVNSGDIIRAVEISLRNGASWSSEQVQDYKPENVSEKVASIISSYTNYVNKVVWKKKTDQF